MLLNTIRTAGGIMVGVGSFVFARTVIHPKLKDSLNMTGIGLILLLGANASSHIILTLYSPGVLYQRLF